MAQAQIPTAEFKFAITSGIQIHLQKNHENTDIILYKNLKKLHFSVVEWEKILAQTTQFKIAFALLNGEIELVQ